MDNKVSLLDTVPVHASQVWTEESADGCLVLVYQRFPKAWMTRLFSRWFSPQIHVPLEQYGSEIWQLMDGKRTTEEVIRLVALRHPEETDFPQRLAIYISQLHVNGFITLQKI